jgi:hypothetical protein
MAAPMLESVTPEELRQEVLEVLGRSEASIDAKTLDAVRCSSGYTDLVGSIDALLRFNSIEESIAAELATIKHRTWQQLQRLEIEAGITDRDA